ncbi:MAG: ATPase [Paludibacter sp.]|nr:ATPase [Paludibacter sp.]
MIMIADSGSTKTTWCVVEDSEILKQVVTPGINPFYQTTGEIQELIMTALYTATRSFQIDKIFFYGAGCAFPDKKKTVMDALIYFFNETIIEVESDLLGTARALFQHQKGIACILGTGSNSCYYDGTQIVQNVSPLGYILGDEGSGAVMGKQLIADCLKHQLPDWLSEKLMDDYELTPAQIIESVYSKPFPNRFLASFTPFLLEHIEEPSIFNLVYDSFDAFFTRNVMHYDLEEMEVGFMGSVAHHFKDTLEIVASERNIQISQILCEPMEGLVKFHS